MSETAMVLTDDEWLHLRRICEDWLSEGFTVTDMPPIDLAKRIIAATQDTPNEERQ